MTNYELTRQKQLLVQNISNPKPMAGDLIRVYKSQGGKINELTVVFEPNFPMEVVDGILIAKGEYIEFIKAEDVYQYKENSTYKPNIKNLINIGGHENHNVLELVKHLYTAL